MYGRCRPGPAHLQLHAAAHEVERECDRGGDQARDAAARQAHAHLHDGTRVSMGPQARQSEASGGVRRRTPAFLPCPLESACCAAPLQRQQGPLRLPESMRQALAAGPHCFASSLPGRAASPWARWRWCGRASRSAPSRTRHSSPPGWAPPAPAAMAADARSSQLAGSGSTSGSAATLLGSRVPRKGARAVGNMPALLRLDSSARSSLPCTSCPGKSKSCPSASCSSAPLLHPRLPPRQAAPRPRPPLACRSVGPRPR